MGKNQIIGKGEYMIKIKPGKYKHFKGNMYQVLGVAKHSETLEEMVVYKALYGDKGLWVRPAKMFTEIVKTDKYNGPRFVAQD